MQRYEEYLKMKETITRQKEREWEVQRRQRERAAEMQRRDAAFQQELRERADGKERALWRRPWEC